MKEYLKEHVALRITLITLFFVVGMALIIMGWMKTGELSGLGTMLVGVVLLLAGLFTYNQPFTD